MGTHLLTEAEWHRWHLLTPADFLRLEARLAAAEKERDEARAERDTARAEVVYYREVLQEISSQAICVELPRTEAEFPDFLRWIYQHADRALKLFPSSPAPSGS